MNKAKLPQSLLELDKAVESGNKEMECHCANSLQRHYTVAGKPAKHLYVVVSAMVSTCPTHSFRQEYW